MILAVPPNSAEQMLADQPLGGVALTDIGEFVAEQKLYQQDAHGGKRLLEPRGYQHKFS